APAKVMPPKVKERVEEAKAPAERGATEGERKAGAAAVARSMERASEPEVTARADQAGKFKVETKKRRTLADEKIEEIKRKAREAKEAKPPTPTEPSSPVRKVELTEEEKRKIIEQYEADRAMHEARN